MNLGEAFVKVVFWPRIRMMRRIGDAAKLIGEGRATETLEILERMERRLPPYVGHLFFLTKGRALDELRRDDEAEKAYIAAVFAREGASTAHLHLAVLCGRLRRFDDSRDWLRRIRDDEGADESLLEQATELEAMLVAVEDGSRLAEMQARASAFSSRRGIEGAEPSAALEAVDEWVEARPEEAASEQDDIALWLGELLCLQKPQAQWELSLSMEDCHVVDGEREIRPFAVVLRRLSGQERLATFLDE